MGGGGGGGYVLGHYGDALSRVRKASVLSAYTVDSAKQFHSGMERAKKEFLYCSVLGSKCLYLYRCFARVRLSAGVRMPSTRREASGRLDCHSKYQLKRSYSHSEYMCLNVIPLLVLNGPRHSIYSNTDIGPVLTYSIQKLYWAGLISIVHI